MMKLDFEKYGGMIPVIVQCGRTMRVRYQCWLNEESFMFNLRERDQHHLNLGEEFEDDAILVNAFIDCDGDAVLFQTRYHGAETVFGRDSSNFKLGNPVTFKDDQELLPVTVQQYGTCEVLMHAYMNAAAFRKTEETGFVHFWSRRRKKLWKKGEESGHLQRVRTVLFDSRNRNLLILVDQTVAACHDGYFSCFYRKIESNGKVTVVGDRIFDPKSVYKK